MSTSEIFEETCAERARLLALLERLTPEQWGSPSLCAGWRVREVVAHMTMPFRTTPLRLVAGLARARFSFDRYADRAARADTARMTDDELLGQLRDNIRHGWRPPGGGEVGALSHDVIHGLDITEPLGLPAPPAERIAAVLRGAGPRNLDYFGVRLDGTRLVATDADVSIGDGSPVRMPVKDVLLVVTGRRALTDRGPRRASA
ncbi:maleylpyruvate isomerase family mycothiol-dependent enzyme [Pseudonocardia adelaidensis]|uniref:Maleylpyruvate isomerase family mycothiol-dependent enzyme n=1 Tax=Pseudonocardia adelaidensis TaxID=648754 RepID=A0ABP9NM24_9PSEU